MPFIIELPSEADYGTPPLYGTVQAMVDRFGLVEMEQISDRVGAVEGIDQVAVARALEDAGAEIDVYLQGRYTLPLVTVPRVLINVACDIARYRLYDDLATDQVTKRYDAAVKLLKSLASGDVGLGLDVQATPVEPDAAGPQSTCPARVFSGSSLGDY